MFTTEKLGEMFKEQFPEKEFRQWLDEAIENGFYENASTQEAQDEAIALWGFEQAKKQMREAFFFGVGVGEGSR